MIWLKLLGLLDSFITQLYYLMNPDKLITICTGLRHWYNIPMDYKNSKKGLPNFVFARSNDNLKCHISPKVLEAIFLFYYHLGPDFV